MINIIQMITDTFQTIQTDYQGIYKEKGSKFISFAFPVTCEEEIKSKLTQLQKKYHDVYLFSLVSLKFAVSITGSPSTKTSNLILRY